MSKYKILLPVETAARELMSKLVLASKFAFLGHECYIGTKNEIFRLFSKVSPFVYFDKGYHQNVSDAIYCKIKQYGGMIANLDEEGGVDFKNCNMIVARYPEKLFEYCDLVFLWGSAQYDLLPSEIKQAYDSKIIITGHPRFDLLKPDYHFLYEDEVEELKQAYNTFILISTNMGFGNNIRGDAFVKQNYGGRIKNISRVIDFDQEKIKKIISLVKRLSPEIDSTIIIRPHPEEKHDVYQEAFGELMNVKVVFEGSVVPWLIGAEIMIHPDCTTGIESMMVGKKPVSYLPDNQSDLCTYAPVEMSNRIHDEDHLIRYIVEKEYKAERYDTHHNTLTSYFNFDCASTDAIVDATAKKMDLKAAPARIDLRWHYPVFRKSVDVLKTLYRSRSKSDSYRLQEHKLRGFTHDVIAAHIRKINTGLLNDRAIRCSRLNRYMYKIIKA